MEVYLTSAYLNWKMRWKLLKTQQHDYAQLTCLFSKAIGQHSHHMCWNILSQIIFNRHRQLGPTIVSKNITSWWFSFLKKDMRNITEQNGQRLVHAKNSLWAARTSNFQPRPRLGNLWTPITLKNLSNLCCITPHAHVHYKWETFALKANLRMHGFSSGPGIAWKSTSNIAKVA